MLVAAAFGLLIGAALGLLGAGGSILAIPALIYGVGLPLSAAVPASLAVVAVSAAGGLLGRLRSAAIRWPVALVFVAASVPSAFLGTALGRELPDRWLLLAFAVLMTAVAVRMLTAAPESGGACRVGTGAVNWRRCLPRALATGVVVGVLTGLFGVGGGFVVVPALTMLLGLTASEAVATSLVVVMVTASAGLGAHLSAAAGLDGGVTAVFAGTSAVASVLAGRFGTRLPAEVVRRWFAWLVLVVAAGVAGTALLAPAALRGA